MGTSMKAAAPFSSLSASISLMLLAGGTAMAGGILSLDMLEQRAIAALSSHYRQAGATVECRSARLDGGRARFGIICGGSTPYLWVADTIAGETVALAPLNEAAIRSAPATGSSLPSGGDPRIARVVSLETHERSQTLTQVTSLFDQ